MATKRSKGKATKGKAAAKAKPAAKKAPPKKPLAKAQAKKPIAKKPQAPAPRAKPVGGPRVVAPAAESIARVAAKWPTLSAHEILAFDSLHTAEQCDGLGRRTKAADVRDEALRWIAQMDGALRTYPGRLAGYAPKRFAYFLHTAGLLAQAVADQESGRVPGGAAPARDAVATTRADAMAKRDAAIERLTTFAGGRANERAALDRVVGTADTIELLVRSLRGLAHLEIEWVELTDPSSRVLADAAGLSLANAEELRELALALGTKSADAAIAARRSATDAPETNRVEGRMLLEMREAKRIFAAAAGNDGYIQRLNPGAAIRSAFGLPRKAAPTPPADEPATPDAPAETPDPTPAAPAEHPA